jgi:hypothetical protein
VGDSDLVDAPIGQFHAAHQFQADWFWERSARYN